MNVITDPNWQGVFAPTSAPAPWRPSTDEDFALIRAATTLRMVKHMFVSNVDRAAYNAASQMGGIMIAADAALELAGVVSSADEQERLLDAQADALLLADWSAPGLLEQMAALAGRLRVAAYAYAAVMEISLASKPNPRRPEEDTNEHE